MLSAVVLRLAVLRLSTALKRSQLNDRRCPSSVDCFHSQLKEPSERGTQGSVGHRKEELPALSRHYTTISQLPRLRAYLSSDRIMPRNKLVTEPERKYVFVRGVGSVPPPDSPAAKGEL